MTRRLSLRLLQLLILVVGPSLLRAQDTPLEDKGLKSFAAYHGGDLDSISLGTGALTLHIPLWSYPQRGGKLRLNYFINYTSNQWTIKTTKVGGESRDHWVFQGTCLPLSYLQGCTTGGVQIKTEQGLGVTSQLVILDVTHGTGYTSYTLTDPSGAMIQLAPTNLGVYRSLDGSGYLYDPTASKIWSRDGTYNGSTNIYDSNGNYTTPGTSTTDTIGRVIPAQVNATPAEMALCDNAPLQTVSATTWNLPAPNDGTSSTAKLIICSVSVHVYKPDMDWGGGGIDTYKPYIQNIILPNGTKWKFEYEALEGNLTKLTLPTGGSIAYTWGAGGDTCSATQPQGVATRAVDSGDGSPHAWSYSWIGSRKTVVADPLNNETVHTFNSSGICSIYEVQTDYYQGSRTGTPIKTVYKTYETFSNPFDHFRMLNFPTSLTTSWPNGGSVVQSKVVTDVDGPGLVGKIPFSQLDPGNPLVYETRFGNAFNVKEYDVGTPTPGSLMRETVNTYLFTSDSTYKGNNLLDLLSSVRVNDGSGTQQAYTTYGYDEAAYPLQPANIATQHVSPPNSSRGNQTSVNQWLNTTSTYLSSHNIFYDTGTVYQAIDPGIHAAHTTTYSYSLSFAGAYPTQTQLPDTNSPTLAHHVTSANYDFNSGVTLSDTDENGRTTSYLYDLLSRPRQIDYPDGGQNLFTYSDTVPTPSLTITTQVTVANNLHSYKTFIMDGVGRLKQVQHWSNGVVYVDSTYDALGRKATVTNPYRSMTGEPTNGTTHYGYDPLARVTTLTQPDGVSVGTSYAANCTTVTDEDGNIRKSCVDGLNRVIQVVEDPGSNPHKNYETDYKYDTLGNLTCVEQHGSATGQSGCSGSSDVGSTWRIRRFTYDSLSRLLTAKNPETGNASSYGTISYAYYPDGVVQTKTSPAPNQTGSATVTITYDYDELHRMVSKAYSDGSTMVKYGYDGGTLTGCVVTAPSFTYTNAIGRKTSMCDAVGMSLWSFDLMGRPLVHERLTVGTPTSTSTKIFNYSYNLDGGMAFLQFPSLRKITYTPESSGSLSSGMPVRAKDLSNNIAYVDNATYAPQGALTSYTNGSAITALFSYNSRLQPLHIAYGTANLPNSQQLGLETCPPAGYVANLMHRVYHFGATLNDNGNVQSVDNCRDTTRTAQYFYDSLNRVTQGNSTGPEWGDTYVIDAWGNLTNMNPMAGKTNVQNLQAANANWKNQLNGHTHDAAGNLINDGVHTYTYDIENRLSTTASWNYYYDGDGNRVKKCSSCSTSNGGTLYWTGGGSDNLIETDLVGTLKAEYIFFNGRRVAKRDGTANPPYYYFADHLGSTSVLTDSTGAPKDESDYFPYGGEIVQFNGVPQNYKFTGKERDSESNLDMFGARYYASSMGRFMIPDWAAKPTSVPYAHFGNPQSLNLYSYVQNNPTTVGDPDGHGDAGTFCNTQCRYGTPVSEGELQVEKGIVELTGAAIAGPEVLAAAPEATTVLQGLGVAVATLGVTGTAVNGTVDIAGGLTHTNVDAGTNAVTSVTNPVAAGVSIATGSMEKGSQAADLTTVVKAGVNLARGKGVSNPAEVGSSLAGAKAAVQGVYNTAKSVISGATAPAPPPPPTPKPPSCSDAGACK